jgi:predicted ATPase
MTDHKNPLAIENITLKNVGPFDDEGLTINFGEKLNIDKANIHIMVGKNGSGKSTVLKKIYSDQICEFKGDGLYNKQTDYPIYIYLLNEKRSDYDLLIRDNFYNYRLDSIDLKSCAIFGDDVYLKNYLNFTEKVWSDRREKRLYELGEGVISQDQYKLYSKKVKIIEVIENLISEIYDIKFAFTYENSVYTTLINGNIVDYQKYSLGYKKLIEFVSDLLIKLYELTFTNYSNFNTAIFVDKENFCNAKFTLLLDEVEVHLHPDAQRKILPAIQKLFPNAEIFCTTHSPFVVNSVSDAWVYELKDGKLKDTRLTKAGDSYGYSLIEDFGINDDFSSDVNFELKTFFDLLHSYKISNLNNSKVEIETLAKKLMNYGEEVRQIVIFNLKKYGLYN